MISIIPFKALLKFPYFDTPAILFLWFTSIKYVWWPYPLNSAGKKRWIPWKKGNSKKIFLSKTFREHPVSSQSSFSNFDLIKLAIIEEIILALLSFLFLLMPPINLIFELSLKWMRF